MEFVNYDTACPGRAAHDMQGASKTIFAELLSANLPK